MPFFDLPQDKLASYRSSTPAPADFDAFWQTTLAETRQHPIDAVFTPLDYGLDAFEIFDVTFSGFGGHRIKGWYIKPAGKQPTGTVVKYIGYGGGRGFPHEHLLWPATGRAVVVTDTRGRGSGWAGADTADPVGSDPAHPGFMTRGITDKASYYYRRVYTDGVRAVEAALTRSETNPDKLAVVGGSQGGGISIAVAGLEPKVKAAMPDVPFLSDFRRAVGLTARDPYSEIVRYLVVHREGAEKIYDTLNYFDGIHFAAQSKAATLFSVALMDDVCPPSTVYASFNAWAGDKQIEVYTFNNHEGGGVFQDRAQVKWLKKALG